MTKCLFYTIEIWGEKAPFSMNSDQRNMITMYLWQKGFLFYFCFNNDLKCACVTHTQARLMSSSSSCCVQPFKKCRNCINLINCFLLLFYFVCRASATRWVCGVAERLVCIIANNVTKTGERGRENRKPRRWDESEKGKTAVSDITNTSMDSNNSHTHTQLWTTESSLRTPGTLTSHQRLSLRNVRQLWSSGLSLTE